MVGVDARVSRRAGSAAEGGAGPAAAASRRRLELDGLRAVAVSLVVVYHLVLVTSTVLPIGAIPHLLHLNAGVELC
ncbi:MAG: hypothetical protein PV358_11225 [Acidimicrobiales bacterium]|nr:hypothetical protein [Acidimicrobiales bacterium]